MRTGFLTFCVGTSLLASCGNKSDDASKLSSVDDKLATSISTGSQTNPACRRVRDLLVDTVVNQTLASYLPTRDDGWGAGSSAGMDVGKPGDPPESAPMAEPAKAEPAMAKLSEGRAAAADKPSGPSHYTTTNVQERGVDEGDQVKTDGKHVYVLRSNELLIAKTWPVESSALIARVQFTKLQGQQLYLHGDTIVVQGTANDRAATRVMVIDIADRRQPKMRTSVDVDGTSIQSRVVGDDIYLAQSATVEIPQRLHSVARSALADLDGDEHAPSALRRAVDASLTQAEIDAAMPKIRTTQGASSAMACRDLFMPRHQAGLALTGLARISLATQRTDYVGAMVSGGQVYASTNSLYVTAGDGLSTHVHQFSLEGNNGLPTYVASGTVEGTLLNSFSMSEWGGDLRIATTSGSGNNLYVMRPMEGRVLNTIGAIRGLAPGEHIKSGRMFGDKGYLVTFRQTDPLYTIDLSNPRKPRVAGELKINGYSSYIHPLGGDLLLTIGQDATSTGQITGMQLQVFDVADPEKPTRRFQEKLSSWSNYSVSSAEGDHHAFTWDPVKRVLAVPASGTTADGVPFNSLVVYGLDRARGFTLYGRVTHRALAQEVLDRQCQVTDCVRNNWVHELPQLSQIDRSIVVDNYLVSVGAAGFEIHSLESLAKRAARVMWPIPTLQVQPVAF